MYREFFALGNFGENDAWNVCYIFRVLFSLFQGLSITTYRRVYFSLCLFFAISGRRTQRKFKPRKKIPIYVKMILEEYTCIIRQSETCMLVLSKYRFAIVFREVNHIQIITLAVSTFWHGKCLIIMYFLR